MDLSAVMALVFVGVILYIITHSKLTRKQLWEINVFIASMHELYLLEHDHLEVHEGEIHMHFKAEGSKSNKSLPQLAYEWNVNEKKDFFETITIQRTGHSYPLKLNFKNHWFFSAEYRTVELSGHNMNPDGKERINRLYTHIRERVDPHVEMQERWDTPNPHRDP